MSSPYRTLHSCIFEPLYARADEEIPFHPTKPTQSACLPAPCHISLSAASTSPPHPSKGCSTMRRTAATIFSHGVLEEARSGLTAAQAGRRDRNSITLDHIAPLDMLSSSASSCTPVAGPTSPQSCPAPNRSRSTSDVADCADDGSIASKLLGSITKSISSPSLLACCKESARETPYQKSLRLREMKLHHCAEELGSESSESGGRSLSNEDYGGIFDSSRCSFARSTQALTELVNEAAHPIKNEEGNPLPAMMISVRSSPNLRYTSSLLSKTKERSFPPPLTHTLPRSNSSDSFSYSLRAYREDGHFLLKEVKVPCRQYFQSSRREGRLTLRLLTTDEDSESLHDEEDEKACKGLQADVEVSICQETGDGEVNPISSDGGAPDQRREIEVMNAESYVGESQVSRLKELKKVDVDGEKGADAERFRHSSALNSLHIAALSSDSSAISKKAKINVISYHGAKADFDFCMAANGKAGTVSFLSLPNHVSPGSLKQKGLSHPPTNCCTKLQMGEYESIATIMSAYGARTLCINTREGATNGRGGKMIFSQGAQARPLGCSSTQAAAPVGYGGLSKSKAASMMVFKDVNDAKCLMENMSMLVATFGNMDEAGKWVHGEEDKKRSRSRDGCVRPDVIKDSPMYNGIKNINIEVKEMEHNHHLKANLINGGYSGEARCSGRKSRRSRLPISSCHANLLQEVPSSRHSRAAAAGLQGKDQSWLHTLHCKEIPYRNHQLPGKASFMKLHCVA